MSKGVTAELSKVCADAVKMLTESAQRVSAQCLQQGYGSPDLATHVALLLLNTLLDDLGDTGYIEEKALIERIYLVRHTQQ